MHSGSPRFVFKCERVPARECDGVLISDAYRVLASGFVSVRRSDSSGPVYLVESAEALSTRQQPRLYAGLPEVEM
jgi:hypothetical protein